MNKQCNWAYHIFPKTLQLKTVNSVFFPWLTLLVVDSEMLQIIHLVLPKEISLSIWMPWSWQLTMVLSQTPSWGWSKWICVNNDWREIYDREIFNGLKEIKQKGNAQAEEYVDKVIEKGIIPVIPRNDFYTFQNRSQAVLKKIIRVFLMRWPVPLRSEHFTY